MEPEEMKMTRRQLAMAAMAAQGVSAVGAEGGKYTGALDAYQSRLKMADFDPVAYTMARYESAPRKLRFQAKSKKEADAWQKQLHAKVTELVGGFPKRTPLKAVSLETQERPQFTREAFVFESRPGMGVFGYVVKPVKAQGKLPVVICIPGHGRGVDDVVGFDETGKERSEKVFYEYDFALQVAEQGMAAVAIEPMAFGCRRDARSREGGLKASACQPTAGSALLLGETMIGWRVWDIMRTIDYIESRSDLDGQRVGCTGISGGGTATLFSTALDPRIRACLVSCYLNSFKSSIMSMSHCIDNYIPGILNWAEVSDVAGLIAPRPFFAESGREDPIFPLPASLQAFAEVKQVYSVYGATDRCAHHVFEGRHQFNGQQGLPFLKKHLGA
jgi:dienelactone hydrolase